MHKGNRPLVVANWKMNFSFNQARDWCAAHITPCALLQARSAAQIVLCPSFDVLTTVIWHATQQGIDVGAQQCSSFARGAYTGQVSAISLAEMGCSYCIIGHNEARSLGHETNDDVARKLELLIKNNITPIICIGETAQEHEQNMTTHALLGQLEPVFAMLRSLAAQQPTQPIVIAYEPVWAIGTGATARVDDLERLFSWIAAQCAEHIRNWPYRLIYGGSVDERNGALLCDIPLLEGFLVGGASLDFQKFEKIVSLFKK